MAWENRDYYREGPTFGSRLGKGSVVTWLLAINFIVFVVDAILSSGMRIPDWMSPYLIGNFNIDQAIFSFQVWRWFTYQFLHGGLLHIAFNMIGLYFFGPMMEQWWGSRRFIAFYLLCGISSAVLFTAIGMLVPGVIVPDHINARELPLIGASGSIFGILIGAAALFPKQRVMLIFPPIPMSLRTMAIIFLSLSALSLIAGAQNAGGDAAHLGGALLGFILVKRPRVLDWADRFSPEAIGRGINDGRYERKRKQAAALEAELDRILAKVKEHGLHSLTRRERKVLRQATEDKRRGGQ